MTTVSRRLLFLAIAASATLAHAEVKVAEPWARATVPGQKVAGVFMKLTADTDSRLVAAASPAAKVVEIHEMSMVDNVMRMRAMSELALPAGRTVELKPGGYHVMLIDIAGPFAVGEKVPLSLTVVDKDGKRSILEISAEVRSVTGAQGASHPKH